MEQELATVSHQSQEQLDSYIAKTQVSFEEYHEWFDDDMSKTLNNNWIKMMQEKYFGKDALGNTSYMEIGIGRGYVLSILIHISNNYV